MPNQQAVVLAAELLARPSVTPDDAGCMQQITDRLIPLGFICNTFTAGVPPVTNLWARLPGARASEARVLVFAGHTDVVPAGDPQAWRSPPFEPTVRDGRLYGRGACDMKSSIAAFVVAVEQFLQECPQPDISIALLLTSDEEGPARHGTAEVCRRLQQAQERLDWCIVGEPTCEARMGDIIKNGRRGSMNGVLSVRGQQGHVAYPDKVRNPVLLLAPALTELAAIEWDRGNGHFGPTTWQVSNIHSGTGATNVVPGAVELTFNFRFGTESTPEQLQRRLCDVLDRHGLDYAIHWEISAHPFLTQAGELVQIVSEAIREECGQAPSLSTSGGTSDGRFIARICPQVIEFGPPNASIHQVDEHVALADIVALQSIYLRTLRRLNKLA